MIELHPHLQAVTNDASGERIQAVLDKIDDLMSDIKAIRQVERDIFDALLKSHQQGALARETKAAIAAFDATLAALDEVRNDLENTRI